MSTNCNRCNGTGFLNSEFIPESILEYDHDDIVKWIAERGESQVILICGDGYGWYDTPGEHYNNGDLPGTAGPYAYNGGLCECD